MEMHVKRLVEMKETAMRKAVIQGLIGSVVILGGGMIWHYFRLPGEALIDLGLIMCGWAARGYFEAKKIETRANLAS